jgi:nucleotide-binding universal stress UspA family protein
VFKHLLVPLDGSAAAEQAAWVAAGIAERGAARITLLHVIEQAPPSRVHDQRHLRGGSEAQQYLDNLADRMKAKGLDVARHVHLPPTRGTAESLGFHAEECGADLVVMCAHGPVRLRDRLVGNLGQQLAGQGHVSVLLLRVTEGREIAFPFRKLLVALDGRLEHERGLAPAAALATACQAPMHLITVVSTSSSAPTGQPAISTYLPGTTDEILRLRQGQAEVYLAGHLASLRRQGIAACAEVVMGDPAGMIARTAGSCGADVVVLTTHGKAGTEAFWSRSLPPKLLRRLDAAFLLVPVDAAGAPNTGAEGQSGSR